MYVVGKIPKTEMQFRFLVVNFFFIQRKHCPGHGNALKILKTLINKKLLEILETLICTLVITQFTGILNAVIYILLCLNKLYKENELFLENNMQTGHILKRLERINHKNCSKKQISSEYQKKSVMDGTRTKAAPRTKAPGDKNLRFLTLYSQVKIN